MQKLKKQFLIFSIFVIFLALNLIVKGQPTHIQLNQLSTNEGLSSSMVISILQDNCGFMWIGTFAGLNRYDGKDFKVYKTNQSDPFSLADNMVFSLYLTEDDNLFIGTNAGLSMYDSKFDRFLNFSNDTSSCLYNLSFQTRRITGDKQGNLYLATNIGLINFSKKNNSYELFTYDTKNANGLSSSLIEDVMFDSNGKLWVSTRSGLNLFDPETKMFRLISKGVNNENFSAVRFQRLAEDNNGAIWITSYNKGLFCIKDYKKNEQLKQYAPNPNDPNSISSNRLLSLQIDKQNNVWVGVENDGLFLFDTESEIFHHYLSRDSDPLSLKTYSVEYLYFDNSENLWIGTFVNGVNIAPLHGDAIVSYKKFKGGDLSIENNVVNYFIEGHDGNIWIGTDGGGLNLFDKESGLFTNFNTSNSEIPNDYITSMLEDKNQIIWMASWGDGIIQFNHKINKFKSFSTRNSNIPDDNIFCIEKGDNNDFWLGSYQNGLIHFVPEQNKFVSIDLRTNITDISYINVIRTGSDGVLYLGTSIGLFSYNPKTEELKKISLSEENSGSLSNLHVYDIFIENETCMWIGTLMGLNCLNLQTGENIKYTIKDGLPSNNIRGVIKKKSGMLWISTNNGLCRFDNSKKKFTFFTMEDGLQSNEFRPKSVFEDSNGALFFGGFNGFNIIYPEKLIQNTRIPEVQITGMDLFNKPVVPNVPDSPLKDIISKTKEIKLKHDQAVITFYFGVMDFARPQKNQHAYKLENFDEDWTNCGSRRNVTYTNLDPGKYIFRVKGANNDGFWNEEGTSLILTITPPWWKTLLFNLIVGFIILLIIFSIYYIRVSTLKKQKIILEATVKKRTNELASIIATKDKLFSIIAHDLRSPFNVILGFTDLLHNDFDSFDEKTIKKMLSNLKKSSESTFVLLKNLLDWSGMQRGTIVFNPVKTSASEIINTSIQQVSALSDNKNIKIISRIEDQTIFINVDTDMLSLVLRNLLLNSIKFSNPGNDILIDVKNETDDLVTFMVIDNGVGIAPDKLKSLFILKESGSTAGTRGEKGTGLGLILCAEFIEKHDGEIWVESQLGKGSTFYFTVSKFKF